MVAAESRFWTKHEVLGKPQPVVCTVETKTTYGGWGMRGVFLVAKMLIPFCQNLAQKSSSYRILSYPILSCVTVHGRETFEGSGGGEQRPFCSMWLFGIPRGVS